MAISITRLSLSANHNDRMEAGSHANPRVYSRGDFAGVIKHVINWFVGYVKPSSEGPNNPGLLSRGRQHHYPFFL
ncbi:MAG TPA: hypothetical protein VFD91_02845 [Mariniphaga sp.]|nr:hypothetical protein [Mariniphaga sp.]